VDDISPRSLRSTINLFLDDILDASGLVRAPMVAHFDSKIEKYKSQLCPVGPRRGSPGDRNHSFSLMIAPNVEVEVNYGREHKNHGPDCNLGYSFLEPK